MYCYHCGKKIDEHKIEKKASSLENIEGAGTESHIEYVCPRCGESIHAGFDERDIKSLSRAAHAEIQRANNSYSSGMGMASIGVILLILGLIFYLIANRPSQGFALDTSCAEFYVFIVLTAIASVSVWTISSVTIHPSFSSLSSISEPEAIPSIRISSPSGSMMVYVTLQTGDSTRTSVQTATGMLLVSCFSARGSASREERCQ